MPTINNKIDIVGFNTFGSVPSKDGAALDILVTFVSLEPRYRNCHAIMTIDPFSVADPENTQIINGTATIKPYRPDDFNVTDPEEQKLLRNWFKEYHWTKNSKDFFAYMDRENFIDEFKKWYDHDIRNGYMLPFAMDKETFITLREYVAIEKVVIQKPASLQR